MDSNLFATMDWDAIAAIAAILSSILVLASFLFLGAQVHEARRAATAQAFLGVVASVQSDEMRSARGHVFKLKDKPVSQWTDEDCAKVEQVCQNLDVFGIVCRYKLIPTRLVATEWGNTIIRIWEICGPYVLAVSEKRFSKNYWRHFEWLNNEARKLAIHRALVKEIASSKKQSWSAQVEPRLDLAS
jgi:hypothetical protein